MKKFWNKYYWLNTSLLWIIGIFLGALLINSCDSTVIQEGSTQTKYKRNYAKFEIIKEFTYKNHDYIMFQTGGLNSSVAGIVHNPECEYCNGKSKSTISECDSLVKQTTKR